MYRPPPSELFWHGSTCPGTMERDDGKRDRTPLAHLTVYPLQVFRRGEEIRVIVANAKIHRKLLLSPGPTSPCAVHLSPISPCKDGGISTKRGTNGSAA